MRRLVVLRALTVFESRLLREAAPEWEVVSYIESGNLEALLPGAEAVVVAGWDERIRRCSLVEGSPLRWIHTWSSGIERIPLEELKMRGIRLTCSRGVYAVPIAESVLLMMLWFARNGRTYLESQLNRQWRIDKQGGELYGKTLGLLGVGGIGREIAIRARAFGMRVLGYRRNDKPVEGVDILYSQDRLDTLVAESDYIVNSLPLNFATAGLVDDKLIRMMKRSAYYINVGRGGTTNQDALTQALLEDRLSGAGLDVFQEEPLPASSPLWQLSNVLLTPHAAGTSDRAEERSMERFLDYFRNYAQGCLQNVPFVDYDEGY
ncbi:D-2-hydroxyacid dehydrogenase [Paenibacillus koleovorans]|uniref:D-2-hydroxyacid dehydrogenase n=1 Tax=Paenibacillus koleovorans TaxID=121608 RepID=UPI000FDA5C7C|nr:D-2-hydroxyacid dehydrogenase [Paenibacillus koleovorans]